MLAISIKNGAGLGDTVQYSSIPENYKATTGNNITVTTDSWIWDYNPCVNKHLTYKSDEIFELFDRKPVYIPTKPPEKRFFTSNAAIHATRLGLNCVRANPRLYRYEDFPFSERRLVLLHIRGISHAQMPENVLKHILTKYKGDNLVQIGGDDQEDLGIQRIHTPSPWCLAELISRAKLFIGMLSGPAWVAACYPQVEKRIVMSRFYTKLLETRKPLDSKDPDTYWDDPTLFKLHNCSENDVSYTKSYQAL